MSQYCSVNYTCIKGGATEYMYCVSILSLCVDTCIYIHVFNTWPKSSRYATDTFWNFGKYQKLNSYNPNLMVRAKLF